VAPSAGGMGGGGGVTSQNSSAPSPAHATGAHRGVQRSISATSSNKPRRGSTGADTAACELMSTTGNGKDPGSGRRRDKREPTLCVCLCDSARLASCV